eukprot:XP_790820.1 PREDICTED: death domain-associated protein 6-like [Strongylocentrotus purpuratus]
MAATNSNKAPDETEEEVFLIIDSDEEPAQESTTNTAQIDYKSLFDEFVTYSNDQLTKIKAKGAEKIKKHLVKVFKAAREDYLSSEEFRNTIQLYLAELQNPDIKDQTIFSVVRDVLIHLKNASKKQKKTKGSKADSEAKRNGDNIVSNGSIETHTVGVKTIKTEPTSDGHDRSEVYGTRDVNDVTSARDVERDGASTSGGVSRVTPNGVGKKVAGPEDAKTASQSSDQEKPSCSKERGGEKEEGDVDKAKRQKNIRRMEKLMGRLDKEIRRYGEKELSLEEMGRDDSSHMIEHKLRKRFVEAWQKWCKLKGHEAKNGRGVEKKVNYRGTRYPEINLKIRKLVKLGTFPDFHDVFSVIKQTNRVKKLDIHELDLRPLAIEVFKDVGELLSKRRINDYMFNPGYASFLDTPVDPATEDAELKTRLEENDVKSKEMMDKELEKHMHLARELHVPGVEPEFDRTSEPEVDPDGSEDDLEEGDWIEYVSDSDESQSAEPSAAKSPETDVTKMEICQDTNNPNENKTGESKNHLLGDESLCGDDAPQAKKIKLENSSNDSQVTGRTSVAVNGIPQSSTEVKSALMSKSTEILHSSQAIVKTEVVRPGVSFKPPCETTTVNVPSPSELSRSLAMLQKKKILSQPCTTGSKPLPASQHRQPETVSCNNTRKEVRVVLGTTEKVPVNSKKGETALIKRTGVNSGVGVGSLSTAILPNQTALSRVYFNSPSTSSSTAKCNGPSSIIQLNVPPSTTTKPGGPSRRIQLNVPASTTTKPGGPSRKIQLNVPASTTTKLGVPSARMQLSVPPSTTTKPGVPSHRIQLSAPPSTTSTRPGPVHLNRVYTNGNAVKRTIIPPKRNSNAATIATTKRPVVLPLGRKNFSQKTFSKQSNGPKGSYREDDDGVIVLE